MKALVEDISSKSLKNYVDKIGEDVYGFKEAELGFEKSFLLTKAQESVKQ